MSSSSDDKEWYVARDGEQFGPLSDDELNKIIDMGHMRPIDLLWCTGMDDWEEAATVFPQLSLAGDDTTDATEAVDVPSTDSPSEATHLDDADTIDAVTALDTDDQDTSDHAAPIEADAGEETPATVAVADDAATDITAAKDSASQTPDTSVPNDELANDDKSTVLADSHDDVSTPVDSADVAGNTPDPVLIPAPVASEPAEVASASATARPTETARATSATRSAALTGDVTQSAPSAKTLATQAKPAPKSATPDNTWPNTRVTSPAAQSADAATSSSPQLAALKVAPTKAVQTPKTALGDTPALQIPATLAPSSRANSSQDLTGQTSVNQTSATQLPADQTSGGQAPTGHTLAGQAQGGRSERRPGPLTAGAPQRPASNAHPGGLSIEGAPVGPANPAGQALPIGSAGGTPSGPAGGIQRQPTLHANLANQAYVPPRAPNLSAPIASQPALTLGANPHGRAPMQPQLVPPGQLALRPQGVGPAGGGPARAGMMPAGPQQVTLAALTGQRPAAATPLAGQPGQNTALPQPHELAGSNPQIAKAATPTRRARLMPVMLMLVSLVSGGWLAYSHGHWLVPEAQQLLQTGVDKAMAIGTTDEPARSPGAPDNRNPMATGNDAPSMDPALTGQAAANPLDASELWQFLKGEYPGWYKNRAAEASDARAIMSDDFAVRRSMSVKLLSLRIKHAQHALTASQPRLKAVAASFLKNLALLSKHSVAACYGYISNGQGDPTVAKLLQDPAYFWPLEAQSLAIMQAISDGRKSPQTHAPPEPGDYRALGTELMTRGWSMTDLQLFTDPVALSGAKPAKVCQMVQDWFTAQLALPNSQAQLRLLVQSLRPVIGG